MCAQLPDGDNEGVQAFALALGVELSQNNGVVRRLPNCNRSSSQHLWLDVSQCSSTAKPQRNGGVDYFP